MQKKVAAACFLGLIIAADTLVVGIVVEKEQRARGWARQHPIYIGGAFNMADLGSPNASGWAEVRDYGARLHVHPVGWRGQWDVIGPVVCPNFKSRYFLYEYDIVDPRTGINNSEEIAKMESFNMTCEAAFCNFDGREMLNNRTQLVADFTSMVAAPLHQDGIFFYFTFSPVATPEIIQRTGELFRGQYWIDVAKDCGADGIGLDFPLSYWHDSTFSKNLVQFIRDARENDLPVILLDSITSQADIEELAVMTKGLAFADALPDAWNMNQWHGDQYHLAPARDVNGDPAGTVTGAALWLYENL
ncbi:MAG: hypothetical protein GYA24_08015 [Candidatus Lokiarchaeota archaeon]|nr:hypothetical protein [Candidatus Lokiarchaeota archaeon]